MRSEPTFAMWTQHNKPRCAKSVETITSCSLKWHWEKACKSVLHARIPLNWGTQIHLLFHAARKRAVIFVDSTIYFFNLYKARNKKEDACEVESVHNRALKKLLAPCAQHFSGDSSASHAADEIAAIRGAVRSSALNFLHHTVSRVLLVRDLCIWGCPLAKHFILYTLLRHSTVFSVSLGKVASSVFR